MLQASTLRLATAEGLSRWTPEQLIAFECEIADAFKAAKIRAPIHLSGGNEQILIDIFRGVKEDDWVFSTWRSHLHCLLKGTPPDVLKKDILAGHSITLNYREQRIVTSAIVGGICPMALGVAWSIKRLGQINRVWCFVGDMTAETGVFHECRKYAQRHSLPITFVIEDNGKSVCTTTREVWGYSDAGPRSNNVNGVTTIVYVYDLPYPHSGADGERVNF